MDYGCTADELEKHFHGCGSVSRVTILCDKYTGHPKGYLLFNVVNQLMLKIIYYSFTFLRFAYVEFADPGGMRNAMAMDESLLRGRQIKVTTFGLNLLFCCLGMPEKDKQTGNLFYKSPSTSQVCLIRENFNLYIYI